MHLLKDLLYNQVLAAALLIFTLVFALIWALLVDRKKKKIVTTIRILFAGTFLAALAHYIPIFVYRLAAGGGNVLWFDVLLNSIQYSIKLFTFGGDIMWIAAESDTLFANAEVASFALFIGSVFYLIAPIFTATFILSFFKNLTSQIKYLIHASSHTHVFLEVNDRSVALASDILKGNGSKGVLSKDLVVFAQTVDKSNDEQSKLIDELRDLGAIIINKSFDSVKFKGKESKRKISFYLISDDEAQKMTLAESIVRKYDMQNVNLYILSDDVHFELMMAYTSAKNIHVRRIEPIRSLIYRNLYENGKYLFEGARAVGNEKVISAIIVGLGQYGSEMLKALSWLCQREGYTLKINAFDSDKNAETRMKARCPELLSPDYNAKRIKGEPYYEINIHSGVDVQSSEFANKIREINDATYIFVCLGSDKVNLETSTLINRLTEQTIYVGNGEKPIIETVIYSSKTHALMGMEWSDLYSANEKRAIRPTNILMTGDIDHFYSLSTLLNDELAAPALKSHLDYFNLVSDSGKADDELAEKIKNAYWKSEYAYRSSIARALYDKITRDLGIDLSITKEQWSKASHEEKAAFADSEHKRWNAYLRSEGYSRASRYGQSKANHVAKLHNCLVPTHELDDDTLSYDITFKS